VVATFWCFSVRGVSVATDTFSYVLSAVVAIIASAWLGRYKASLNGVASSITPLAPFGHDTFLDPWHPMWPHGRAIRALILLRPSFDPWRTKHDDIATVTFRHSHCL
jgi:hypothetical protein